MAKTDAFPFCACLLVVCVSCCAPLIADTPSAMRNMRIAAQGASRGDSNSFSLLQSVLLDDPHAPVLLGTIRCIDGRLANQLALDWPTVLEPRPDTYLRDWIYVCGRAANPTCLALVGELSTDSLDSGDRQARIEVLCRRGHAEACAELDEEYAASCSGEKMRFGIIFDFGRLFEHTWPPGSCLADRGPATISYQCPNGIARRAGLVVGDRLVEVNGLRLDDEFLNPLSKFLPLMQNADRVDVVVERNGTFHAFCLAECAQPAVPE